MQMMKFYLNHKTGEVESLPACIAERAINAPGIILEYNTIANPFKLIMGNEDSGTRFIRKALDLAEFRNHWKELPKTELLEILYGEEEETEFP
jgi:hypothetical protein